MSDEESVRKIFQEFARELERIDNSFSDGFIHDLLYGPQEEYKGYYGFFGALDEIHEMPSKGDVWPYTWAWWERPSRFTPQAFQKLWDSFSEQRKIDYVLSLITG